MPSGGQVVSPASSPLGIIRTERRDWTMERIAIGDGVYYANYKAPFQQLEGAITGYPVGELPYDANSKLLCPYDDPPKTFNNLGAHIAKKHGMNADQFKTEAGLNQDAALVSEQTRFRNGAALRRRTSEGRGLSPHRLTSVDSREGAARGGRGRRTPQALNRRNVCYDQVLLTAARIQRETGKITESRLRKEGVSYRIIELHFGSWEAFLKRMGEAGSRSGVRRQDRDLIQDLRSVAMALGHTPTVSDKRRYQMAGRTCYEKHFGSWVAACERAGVQPNVPAIWSARPFTHTEDSAILGAYAVTGSVVKAAERHGISAVRAKEILARFGLVPINGNAVNHRQREEQMSLAAELARRLAS